MIDELYALPEHRGSGHATRLLQRLSTTSEHSPKSIVALVLKTTPGNSRARRLYERIGFRAANMTLRLRLPDAQR